MYAGVVRFCEFVFGDFKCFLLQINQFLSVEGVVLASGKVGGTDTVNAR
jgi:hypothetical protein